MSRLATALQVLQRDLAGLDIAWALAGGLAVSARTEPRFTRDIDIAVVADDDRAAERVVFELGKRGYLVTATIEHLTAGRLATARLMPPGEPEGGILIDLLLASSGVEAEIVAAAEALEVFPCVTVPVCTTAHLVVLKILARDDDTRPQDRVDLVTLAVCLDDPGWAEASRLADLIRTRGFDRSRDLAAALSELRERYERGAR